MGASSPIEMIQTLGKYTLLEKIGEGYLGSVYRGFDRNLEQFVAIRILCDGIKWGAKIEELYNCQCRSVAGLKYAGIASVLDFGKEGQFHYIVTEPLGNSNLKNLIAQRPAMTVEAKLAIMIQVADGLNHAHQNGILHRDLGPAKIHLTADGKIKIRDFAVASVLMRHLPHPWIRFGTPIYLSPEQIQQKNCDQRSDIFSAGTVFYELLTYLHPFHDRDSNKALDNILQDTQIPTFEVFPDEPPGIWPILKTCLARDPNDRYGSMDEVSNAFGDLLKDLAEDSRLMLSELYSALSPLRKAAAKHEANKSTIALLEDIERLLSGEKEPDYISLDRLMTALVEEYPSIQVTAGAVPALDSTYTKLPSEGVNGWVGDDSLTPSFTPLEGKQDRSPIELALTTVLSSNKGEPEAIAPDTTPATLPEKGEEELVAEHSGTSFSEIWDPSSELQFAFETSFIKPGEDRIFAPTLSPAPATLEQNPSAIRASVAPEPLVNSANVSFEQADKKSELEDERENHKAPGAELMDSSPTVQAVSEIPTARQEEEKKSDDRYCFVMAAPATRSGHDSTVDTRLPGNKKTGIASSYRRIRRPSYRTTVVLLSLLLLAAAAYIVWSTGFAASLSGALKERMPDSGVLANAFGWSDNQHSPKASTTAGARSSNPAMGSQSAIPAASEPLQISSVETTGSAVNQPPQDRIFRISRLINSGRLQLAKAELDRLQQTYPTAPQIFPLRRQWEAKNSIATQELTRKQQEQLTAAWKQKEDEYNRRLATLLARGQYGEANSTLSLWLAEDPGSPGARDIGARIGEIQRYLNIYASAMAENKYPEALNALAAAERLNPADATFVELRRQIEARKAAAKASLSVHRIGAKATFLLDGRPIGNDGEVENEIIPIGNHMLSVESGGNQVASRRQEFVEGQRISMVYDLSKQLLRPMVEPDRELLAQRKTMEEVRYFDVEHDHGTFRGSCRGLLMMDYLDIAFRPSAGFHGFRMPFKLIKINVKGKSVDLIGASDNKQFQSFKFHDEQTAERFKRSWDELKSLAHQ